VLSHDDYDAFILHQLTPDSIFDVKQRKPNSPATLDPKETVLGKKGFLQNKNWPPLLLHSYFTLCGLAWCFLSGTSELVVAQG
jgi:hypothetical protein